MIEVRDFEEVTQIRLAREIDGQALFWVAAYLVDGLLIDSGCAYTAGELGAFLEKHPPKLAVNTHFHEDHIGANHVLQQRFGIPVYAHPESLPLIARRAELLPYQEFVWGYPEPTDVLPIPEAIRTEHFTFNVIETPGHSRGHVVLFERSRGWCFSGDIYPGRAIRTIRPEEDMGAIVSSLRRIATLGTERLVLLTSIGRIIENGREALADFIRSISALSLKAKGLQARGISAGGIVTELFGGEDPRSERTNNHYTTENLVRTILKMA